MMRTEQRVSNKIFSSLRKYDQGTGSVQESQICAYEPEQSKKVKFQRGNKKVIRPSEFMMESSGA